MGEEGSFKILLERRASTAPKVIWNRDQADSAAPGIHRVAERRGLYTEGRRQR